MLWHWMLVFVSVTVAAMVTHMTRSWSRVGGCLGAILVVALVSAAALGLGGGLLYGVVWVVRQAWGR